MKAAGLTFPGAVLFGFAQPRAQAFMSPRIARVVPPVSTSIAGIGITLSE